ncbi:kinase-like protein [Sistotremastrum suecicum HHB10207 ss-3]|uniref:Kinase-like protein n=1 Tax=Sistotremastrum suecicum HHB10207 ss-3 TaxID=1314776 RepID=A0A166ABB2_9AGAM|nr:kinase-like protein [Sistotremastrum suecicum HHB10207 ss-3]
MVSTILVEPDSELSNAEDTGDDHSSSSLDVTQRIIYLKDRPYAVKSGGQADIYLADLDGMRVAVKVMRHVEIDARKRRSLIKKTRNEIFIWSSLHHPNVLSFKGFCFFPVGDTEDSLFSLVSPWMTHGTVMEYIEDHPEVDKVLIMSEICQGLVYLHAQDVVHGDLKGPNIFVSDRGHPVLADFGLSRLEELDEVFTTSSITSSSANPKGTTRYMAPEMFDSFSPKPSKATDIWALGCLMLVSDFLTIK